VSKVLLRAIEAGDLPIIQRWRNSDKVMPYCRQYRPLSLKDMGDWYLKLSEDKDYNLTNDLFIIDYDYKSIGVCGLVRLDWRNRKAELSFYVGEAISEATIREAFMAIIRYGLATLNLWKISFPCYSFNPYIPLYEEMMNKEYIAKSEYYHEGKYYDRIVLVKYNETKL